MVVGDRRGIDDALVNLVIEPQAQVILAFNPDESKSFGIDPRNYLKVFNAYKRRFKFIYPWGSPDNEIRPSSEENVFSARLVSSEAELGAAILDAEKEGILDAIVNGLYLTDDSQRLRLLQQLVYLREGEIIDRQALFVDIASNPPPNILSKEYEFGASDVMFPRYFDSKTRSEHEISPQEMVERLLDKMNGTRINHFAPAANILIAVPRAGSLEEEIELSLRAAGASLTTVMSTKGWLTEATSRGKKYLPDYSAIILSDETPITGLKGYHRILNRTRFVNSRRFFVMRDGPTSQSLAREILEAAPVVILSRSDDPREIRDEILNKIGVYKLPKTDFRNNLVLIKWGGSLTDRMAVEGPQIAKPVLDEVVALRPEGRALAAAYKNGESSVPGFSMIMAVGGGAVKDILEKMGNESVQSAVNALNTNSATLSYLLGGLSGRVLKPDDIYSLKEREALESILIIPELPPRVGRFFIPGYRRQDSDPTLLLVGQVYNPTNNSEHAPGAGVTIIYIKDLPMVALNGTKVDGRMCNHDPNDHAYDGEIYPIYAISAKEVLEGKISRHRDEDDTDQHLVEDSALIAMTAGVRTYVNGIETMGQLNVKAIHVIGPYPDQLRAIVTGQIDAANPPGSLIYKNEEEARADPKLKPYLDAQDATLSN